MLLMLLRHGVAEDKSLPIPDSWRKLTADGRQALIDFYPKLLKKIDQWIEEGGEKDDNPPPNILAQVEIWTSPKKRAIETAELLAQARAWPIADPLQSIASGDIHSFWAQLKEREDLDLVIAAGHEPYFSRWVGMITGEQITIAKGAAVALDLNLQADGLSGEVAWYLKPDSIPGSKRKDKKFKRASKKKDKYKAPPQSEANKRLDDAYQAIIEQEERFLDDAEDPDPAHKLRVKTRTLRALLSFYRPRLNIRNYREVQDGLRASAHMVERLRELDVLIEAIGSLEADAPVADLLSFLKDERRTEAETVRTLVEAGRLDELRQPCLRLLRRLELTDDVKYEEKRYKTWRKRILSDQKRLDDLRYSGIHRLRIRAKKARYALEAIPTLRGEKQEDELMQLRDLQDRLGLICDWYRNREFMDELLQLEPSPAVKEGILYYIGCLSEQEHHIMT